jgi:hypothetical protein
MIKNILFIMVSLIFLKCDSQKKVNDVIIKSDYQYEVELISDSVLSDLLIGFIHVDEICLADRGLIDLSFNLDSMGNIDSVERLDFINIGLSDLIKDKLRNDLIDKVKFSISKNAILYYTSINKPIYIGVTISRKKLCERKKEIMSSE